MMNPLELHAMYRDWWCQCDSNSVALMEAINRSGCYVPRFFVAPAGGNLAQNLQTPGTYVPWVMQIPPGSFIYAIYMNLLESGFSLQVTDLGLSYPWFNTPISSLFFLSQAGNGTLPPAAPYLLPCLYPVMEPGTFKVELWSTADPAGPSTQLSVTFAAAVPIEAA